MAKKFNNEGYADPTAFEALNRIEQEEREARYRPIVYICSPFSGKEHENKILPFRSGKAHNSVRSTSAFSAVYGR